MPPDPATPNPSIHGRGSAHNPPNRFEHTHQAPDPDPQPDPDDPSQHSALSPQHSISLTQFLPDSSRSIIATNNSPDIPFAASINPYRGCEHGCIYCYARPTHEYLGFSAGLDFETKILVKHHAPELLRAALNSPQWHPQTISISGVTDCYQPVERKLQLTRRILEVLRDFRNPVGLITKNHLVTRDLDILRDLAAFNCINVYLSITTLDPHLTQIMEPRTSTPARRLDALRHLSSAGIPVGVIIAPVIPALTDHEMPAILQAARDAGATSAAFIPLRLPYAVKDLFTDWLARHFPDRQHKVLNRIRDLRGGQLNDPNPGSRMRGQGPWADHLAQTFQLHSTRLGFAHHPPLSTTHFHRPATPPPPNAQLPLFQ